MSDFDSFFNVISTIKNTSIRSVALRAYMKVPAYFFEVPASSSGKYHPEYALGEGGLVRHVLAAIKIAESMMESLYNFSEVEQDLIKVSLLFHDCWKQGYTSDGKTLHEHPNIAAFELVNDFRSKNIKEIYYSILIALNIMTHMGRWTTSPYSKIKLFKPVTKMQKFVHLCDYLASRKFLEVIE